MVNHILHIVYSPEVETYYTQKVLPAYKSQPAAIA